MKLTYALSDSPDSNARAAGLNLQQALGRYSLSVILHLCSDTFSFATYPDESRLAGGVSVYICSAFLHLSEDCKLHIAWESSNIVGNIQGDGYVTAFRQPLYIHFKRGCETAFVEQWWM
jgi:hypothetical protein